MAKPASVWIICTYSSVTTDVVIAHTGNLMRSRGIACALGAAALFGASAPMAKVLLHRIEPWMLAALLYLGSGIGLWLIRSVRGAPTVRLSRSDAGYLTAAIVSGGMIGPVLLMSGLSMTTASSASLLLNAEGVLTALIAWLVFHENFDRRIALGMLAITAGALVLAWPRDDADLAGGAGSFLILAACLAWAVDNNLTRKVSLTDATFIAMAKGLVAGATNVLIAVSVGAMWPGLWDATLAGVLGLLSYGASLVLFVIALRHLGTARTGAYFSVGPFIGAAVAIPMLGESPSTELAIAAFFMAVGLWLHLTERHEHSHTHMPMEHSHEHSHGTGDEHHEHDHDARVAVGTVHSHWHLHEAMTHTHRHYPDAHHRHEH